MKIIRLHTVPSTNTYLKELCKQVVLDNFTVVITNHQTEGRGQQEAVWQAEKGKNLTFSFYISQSKIENLFLLNIAVALGIRATVFELTNMPTYIKWPNDIVLNNQKIAGILIESSINSEKIDMIIGIGLNVNQLVFNNLEKATSLQKITKNSFEIEEVLKVLILNIKHFWNNSSDDLWQKYHQNLYRINQKLRWELPNGTIFLAELKGVTANGNILLEDENFTCQEFATKAIKMVW